MYSKKKLAIFLSKLKDFENPSTKLEQYSTDSEIASEVLWFAKLNGDIENKIIADFGCGTGILGIGAFLLGAKKLIFIDKDEKSLAILNDNLELIENSDYKIINDDIKNINVEADIIIQNPPFGAKRENRNADKIFLEKALTCSNIIYSFHKSESKRFIESISKENNFKTTNYFEFNWPLKRIHNFHKKKIQYIKVGCWRLEKIIK